MAVPTESGFFKCAVTGTLYDTCNDQQIKSAIVIGRSVKGNTNINCVDVVVSNTVLFEDDSWAASGVQISNMR